MLKRQVFLQRAYVLHTRPFRDSSVIAELFSVDYGRTSVLAKGIKRPRSPMRGLVRPFQPLLVSWAGRGDLPVLVGAEVDGRVAWLRGKAIITAYYLNELLFKMVRRYDPMPDLFAHYDHVMQVLAEPGDDADQTSAHWHLELQIRYFENRLLQEVGYGLNLETDSESRQSIRSDGRYFYRYDSGAELLDEKDPLPRDRGMLVHGRTLLELAVGKLSDARSLREAKQLLRGALVDQIGDKPLASREMYRGIVAQERAHADEPGP